MLRLESPAPGPASTFAERLKRYLGQDPALLSALRGASRQQLDEYAKWALHANADSIPLVMRQLFELLGVANGGLFKISQLEVNVDQLIRFYDSVARIEPDTVMSPQLPAIGIRALVGGEVCLDLRAGPQDNPRVVDAPDGEVTSDVSCSLEHYVFRSAFLTVEGPRWPFRRSWAGSELTVKASGATGRIKEIVEDFVAKQGANLLWFGEDSFLILDHPLGILSVDHDTEGVRVEMFAETPAPFEPIAAPFIYAVGAR
jgi:hypothetical protein